MTLTWEDVTKWKSSTLAECASNIKHHIDTLLWQSDDLVHLHSSGHWKGSAADEAKTVERRLQGQLEHSVAAYAKAKSFLREAADYVVAVESHCKDAISYAQEMELAISSDGRVSDARTAHPTFATQPEADTYTSGRATAVKHCADLVSKAMGEASHVDKYLDAALANCRAEKTSDNGAANLTEAVQAGEEQSEGPVDYPPPASASPQAVHKWWASLSDAQREDVITEHPDWIGNRDGIDYKSRSRANELRLPGELTKAEREAQAHKDQEPTKEWTGLRERGDPIENPAWSKWNSEQEKVDAKVKSLKTVQSLIGHDDHHLISLDTSHERVQAAMSSGDLDRAKHIGVFTPGATSSVDKMSGYVSDMKNLRQDSARLGGEDPASYENFVWLDYQAPPKIFGDDNEANSDKSARAAAPHLANFYRGIDAVHNGKSDVTAMGHSYGSLTTSLALRQSGTGVDRAVFFGSPGLGTSDLDDFKRPDIKVPENRIYNIVSDDDPIRDATVHGPQPSLLDGVVNLEDDAVPSQHLVASHGHSGYFVPGTTSERNLAILNAGLDHQVILRHDHEKDIDLQPWIAP